MPAERIPIDSGVADGVKVIKTIQKMSMQNNIFSAEVRQLLLDANKYECFCMSNNTFPAEDGHGTPVEE